MKAFENEILSKLLSKGDMADLTIVLEAPVSEIEFSGVGYFLTIKDSRLPEKRIVLDKPLITGKLGGVEVGYLAFIESSELMLECYSYDNEVNSNHRDQGFIRNAT